MTARVLPCVGLTASVANGIQSIWIFIIPVIAPLRSGEHQAIPPLHVTKSRSSVTFGCDTSTSSGNGKLDGLNVRASAPSNLKMRADFSVIKRLNDLSRKEP